MPETENTPQTTPQTNKERLKEIVDGIEQGIKDLFQSERYRTYLSVMSRFHRYSVNNTLLIYLQKPNASLVAGFNKWKYQFGRYVKKGERGITIIAPTPFKKKIEEVKLDPDTKAPMLDDEGRQIMVEREVSIPMFKPVKVFDVSQTAGKPLPELAATLTGAVQQYDVFLEALRRTAAIPVYIKPIQQNTDGYFNLTDQTITIREGMSEVQTICALVHEITHSRLHNYEKARAEAAARNSEEKPVQKDRRTEEVEAESVSFSVCQYFGIQTGENSFGYIASWSEGKELKELRDSLETISKTADTLITDIEKRFLEVCRERGIDPKALPEAEQPAPQREPETPPDAFRQYADDLCDHIEKLENDGKVGRQFKTLTKDEAASSIAGMLRSGSFDSTRRLLAEIEKLSGEPAPEALHTRLEELSDEWDKGLSYRLETNVFEAGQSHLEAYVGEASHGILFTGSTTLCEKLLSALNEGSATARQVRALAELWERTENTPVGDPEKLWLLDGSRYLHIQITDAGYDYSLYAADTLKLLDGGQFCGDNARMHPADTLMDGAFREACILQGLEPMQKEVVSLDKLAEIKAANTLPPAPEIREDAPDLPDPTVTPEMMRRHGYKDLNMLPLSKDRALELADQDAEIYMLYPDSTEAMVLETKEIETHPGLFGIDQEDWEAIRATVPPRDVEKRFMDNPRDAYAIYQLRDTAPPELSFADLEHLNGIPDRAYYAPVYTGDLLCAGKTGEKLEGLFQTFNVDRPGDFFGHSLSVSDIVALKQDGDVSYHYCDSVGFKALPDFGRPDKGETQAEKETVPKGRPEAVVAKAQKPSILERLKQPLPKQTNKTAPHRSAEREI